MEFSDYTETRPHAATLTGSEKIAMSQGGSAVEATTQEIADLSSGGHVIEDEGTPLTQRADLNFVGAGVTATDAGGKTVITIPGGGAVDSVNSQTGAVVLDAGDIGNTPAGGIAATDVQAAINELDTEKDLAAAVVNTFTADHILAATDVSGGILGRFGKVRMNLTGTANNLTVPPNATVAFQIGTEISVTQQGTGVTTFVQGAGVTITPPAGGNLISPGQGQAVVLTKTGTNTWDLYNGNAPSAVTKTDDTNVTMTLGGSPTVSVIAPVSFTLGWTGLLATARGGTGADNTTQTYTPTLTNSANITASTPRLCTYTRNNNVVTVSGQFDIDPTTTSTLTTLGMSLPIASNFTTAFQAGGTAAASAVTDGGMAVFSDATNDRVTFQYVCTDTTNHTMCFSFTYQII